MVFPDELLRRGVGSHRRSLESVITKKASELLQTMAGPLDVLATGRRLGASTVKLTLCTTA